MRMLIVGLVIVAILVALFVSISVKALLTVPLLAVSIALVVGAIAWDAWRRRGVNRG